jgi:hypothetical protein
MVWMKITLPVVGSKERAPAVKLLLPGSGFGPGGAGGGGGGPGPGTIVMTGGGAVTVKDCVACNAGSYSPLPAWFASMVQVPALMRLTVDPEIVQVELVDASIVKVTGSFDVDDSAVTL